MKLFQGLKSYLIWISIFESGRCHVPSANRVLIGYSLQLHFSPFEQSHDSIPVDIKVFGED